MPECEFAIANSTEIRIRLHGLEFARVGTATSPRSFSRGEEIVFGSGAQETTLTSESAPLFDDLMQRLRELRRVDADKRNAVWRMRPERWMESEIQRNISALEASLDPQHVYAQVPAFAAADRRMIDLLAATHDGRLAVIELKADEDIHLPLQGLDYWARVKWHHEREEFHRFGYFVSQDGKSRQLSNRPPLLMLVAPALHIHPATDTILHYFSAEIDWHVIAPDEHWREKVKVVFRKRRSGVNTKVAKVEEGHAATRTSS